MKRAEAIRLQYATEAPGYMQDKGVIGRRKLLIWWGFSCPCSPAAGMKLVKKRSAARCDVCAWSCLKGWGQFIQNMPLSPREIAWDAHHPAPRSAASAGRVELLPRGMPSRSSRALESLARPWVGFHYMASSDRRLWWTMDRGGARCRSQHVTGRPPAPAPAPASSPAQGRP